jgi:hypothetical protein
MPRPFAQSRFVHRPMGTLTESTCSLCSRIVAIENDLLQLYLAQAAHTCCHGSVRAYAHRTESQESRSLEESHHQANHFTKHPDLRSDSD